MSAAPADLVVSLAGACRSRGLDVPPSATIACGEAIAFLGPRGLGDLYWAGRATLVRRPEDIDAYDDAWASVVAGVEDGPGREPIAPELVAVAGDGADGGDGTAGPALRWSADEVLRRMDVSTLDDEVVATLISTLEIRRAQRRSRRRRPAVRGRGRPDLGRTVRRSLRTGGETFGWVRTHRTTRPRRLVFLVDVSGSMQPYAVALLRFAHRARAGTAAVEVFALGTRLTRLTRALGERDVATAMAAASDEVVDWAGGTRLGEGLRAFNDGFGGAGAARGATVVILSDGWDCGDVAVLGEQMARLGRVAHRVIWVNPLKAGPGYEPLAAGMAAALPHVDHFVSGHSIAALEELVEVIAA